MDEEYSWNRIRDEIDAIEPTSNTESLIKQIARALVTIAEAQEVQTHIMLEAAGLTTEEPEGQKLDD